MAQLYQATTEITELMMHYQEIPPRCGNQSNPAALAQTVKGSLLRQLAR